MPYFGSASSNQIKRTISGSLSNVKQRQDEDAKFLARIGMMGCLLMFLIFYLCAYLSALHEALHQASSQKVSSHNKESVKEMRKQMFLAKHDTVRKDVGKLPNLSTETFDEDYPKKETLVLQTSVGEIRIVLRPDLSKESVEYVKQVVETDSCQRCSLYRAEKPGILQGIMKSSSVARVQTKGTCPSGYEKVPNKCPKHDTSCACHGPIMSHGMVGWAAGQTGPDFFMDTYKRPADWWGTQHTVWGEIEDEASFAVIDHIFSLPTHKQQGLTHLDEPLKFDMMFEQQ